VGSTPTRPTKFSIEKKISVSLVRGADLADPLDEVFSDLLKVAADVATPATAIYKGDPVVVIPETTSGTLTKVYYEGKTEDDAFSVKTDQLKPLPVKKDKTQRAVERVEKMKTNVQAEAPDFIDSLRKNSNIRVQLPQASIENFAGLYESLTGDKVDEHSPNLSVIPETSKWGVSLTVLFPKDIVALAPAWLKPYQYVHSNPNVWAINNNNFCYELFAIGFKLGSNHSQEGGSLALNP
jgi:hypothetical protein